MIMEEAILLSGSGTGGQENNVANITVPFDGILEGIQMSADADMETDADAVNVQVSKFSVYQAGNNSRGVLANATSRISLTTSGVAKVSVNYYVPVGIRVDSGSLIYLHINASATTPSTGLAVLFFSRRRT
jgi:hypothetical protein